MSTLIRVHFCASGNPCICLAPRIDLRQMSLYWWVLPRWGCTSPPGVWMFAACQQPLPPGSQCAEGCQCQLLGQLDVINLDCPSSNTCKLTSLSLVHLNMQARFCQLWYIKGYVSVCLACNPKGSSLVLRRPVPGLPVTLASSGRGVYPRMPMRHLWQHPTICNWLSWSR